MAESTSSPVPSNVSISQSVGCSNFDIDEEEDMALELEQLRVRNGESGQLFDDLLEESNREGGGSTVFPEIFGFESFRKQFRSKLKFSHSEKTNKAYENIVVENCQFYKMVTGKEWKIDELGQHLVDGLSIFLFYKCEFRDEKIDLHDGSVLVCQNLGMSTAITIRSALSHYWSNNLGVKGKAYNAVDNTGNPALAPEITRYFNGLRKRKAKAGVVSESVRALLPDDMLALYKYCMLSKEMEDHRILGSMLYCAYLIAYLCLLRIDEVLNIDYEHIQYDRDQISAIEFTLPFRKTHQDGCIKPFVLKINNNPAECHLCPLRAIWTWQALSRRKSGPFFRKVDNNDILHETRMSYHIFKNHFEHQLRKIGKRKWWLYGTHSFRRGGCQYYLSYLEPPESRWDVKKLADWGGWSTNFDSNAMFRYIIGVNDAEACARERYMDKPLKRKYELID